MNQTTANNKSSQVFYNDNGYVEMRFDGIISTSELRRLLYEMNQLVDVHGPMACF